MQDNGNRTNYGRMPQQRPMQYDGANRQTTRRSHAGAQYPDAAVYRPQPTQRQSAGKSPAAYRRQDAGYSYGQQNMYSQPYAAPAPQQVYMTDMEVDLDTPAVEYDFPSHDMPFEGQRPQIKSAVIASVLTVALACGGFVTSRIKDERATDAVAQNVKVPIGSEDILPSQTPVIVEAANVLSVTLNTAAPAFGSARLQIDFEVDADAVVRVEILHADGSVFYVVEEAMELSAGKMRTYFDGKNAQGEWISMGSYQVRVSSLRTAQQEENQSNDTDGAQEQSVQQDWIVDNSKSVDFAVNLAARPTQNSHPAIIATPTPSLSPSPSPDVSPDVSPDGGTTPTPGTSEVTVPTLTPTPSTNPGTGGTDPTPTPSADPTPVPNTPDPGTDGGTAQNVSE